MEPTITSKLPHVGTTIFTVMSSLAVQHKAVNLGQGFPDFPMDPYLLELVNKSMADGNNQYVHMSGLPALRKVLAEKVFSLYNTAVDSETDITITPGGTYAIYTAFTSILSPGDEVIMFEPSYDSYIPNIEINGAIAVTIPLDFPDYTINWEKVKQKISAKTRAIIINTPHNPSGTVFKENDIQQLREIVEGTNIIIISDEVYEHLIYDNQKHLSILRYPDLLARSFVCFSFGKVFHCTGWKMGYCIGPAGMMKEFRKVHQFNCFTSNSSVQFAFAEYLKDPASYLTPSVLLQSKRDYFENIMKQTRFVPLPSSGSYFQLYRYDNITNESENDFAIRLTKDYGVATIPVSAFYKKPVDNKVLRFCFAKKESTLDEAVSRLLTL